MAKRTKQPELPFKVGDHILYCSSSAAFPWHWIRADVLWFDGDDLMVRRYTQNGKPYNQLLSCSGVVAVGDPAELTKIQAQAADGVKELQSTVDEATSALGRARVALFARLDELAAGGLKLSIPDFDAIEAARKHAVLEVADTEDAEFAAAMSGGAR